MNEAIKHHLGQIAALLASEVVNMPDEDQDNLYNEMNGYIMAQLEAEIMLRYNQVEIY